MTVNRNAPRLPRAPSLPSASAAAMPARGAAGSADPDAVAQSVTTDPIATSGSVPAAPAPRPPAPGGPQRVAAATGHAAAGRVPRGPAALQHLAALEAAAPPVPGAPAAPWDPSDHLATVLEDLRTAREAARHLPVEHQLRLLALGVGSHLPLLGELPPAAAALAEAVPWALTAAQAAFAALDGASAQLADRAAAKTDGSEAAPAAWWTPHAIAAASAAITARADAWADAVADGLVVLNHRADAALTACRDAPPSSPADVTSGRSLARDRAAHGRGDQALKTAAAALRDDISLRRLLRARLAALAERGGAESAQAPALRRASAYYWDEFALVQSKFQDLAP